MSCRALILAIVTGLATAAMASPLPVVIWHGMGDSCCSPRSIGSIATLISEELGVFVHSISTGQSEAKDILGSYFGNVNQQVEDACEQLRSITELSGGYNAVGFSQGGQFMRAVAQRCGSPRMHTLVTMGAQHQGIMNVPSCDGVLHRNSSSGGGGSDKSSMFCRAMQELIGRSVWLPFVRDGVVQAQYFKDPARMDEYLSYNPFLPDINNERVGARNNSYAAALGSLQRLVLFMWEQDDMVVPRESAWFGTWDPEQGRVLDLEETPLYKEDWIGLRRLHEGGRLERRSLPGGHMHISLQWFRQQVVQKYLQGNTTTAKTIGDTGGGRGGLGENATVPIYSFVG